MLQKYYKAATQNLAQHPVFPIINIGSLAAGIATALLIFLAGHTSGNGAFNRTSPSLAFMQVQDSSEVQELGQTLLMILMFDKAGEKIPGKC